MQVLQEVYGLEGDRLWTAASGFGGGLGRFQSVCGALAGGTIALGLLEGRAGGDPKAIANEVRPGVRRLLEGFKGEFGQIDCRALVGFDFNAPGGYEAFRQSNCRQERCQQYVRHVVESLTSELEELRHQ